MDEPVTNWETLKDKYNLRVLYTIGDGSCFIHSILQCMYPYYCTLSDSEKGEMAKKVRKEIADLLYASYVTKDGVELNMTRYQRLGDGYYAALQEVILNKLRHGEPYESLYTETTIDYLYADLNSQNFINYDLHLEIISQHFKVNIFLIYNGTLPFKIEDSDIRFKYENSILIYKTGSVYYGHYSSVALPKYNEASGKFIEYKIFKSEGAFISDVKKCVALTR